MAREGDRNHIESGGRRGKIIRLREFSHNFQSSCNLLAVLHSKRNGVIKWSCLRKEESVHTDVITFKQTSYSCARFGINN